MGRLQVEERELPQVMNRTARLLPPARRGVAVGGQTQAQQYLNPIVEKALELATLEPERRFLERRIRELSQGITIA